MNKGPCTMQPSPLKPVLLTTVKKILESARQLVVNTGKMSSGTILTKTGAQATILLSKATGKSSERDEYSANERCWGNDCTDDPAGRRSQGIYHNENCGDVLHHVRILSKRLEC